MTDQTSNSSTSIATNQVMNVDIFSLLTFKDEFVINLRKNSPSSILNEKKRKCRIKKFAPGWTTDEILNTISKLDSRVFKNLFIFGIKLEEIARIRDIQEVARKFCEKRPLIICLEVRSENKKKIFFVNENSDEWMEITEVKQEKVGNFSSFYSWLSRIRFTNMNILVTKALEVLSSPDQLTLRFLSILNINSDGHFHLLSHCAANYSKTQFLAALGTSFGGDERFLDESQSCFIRKTFTKLKKSILQSAIENENDEVLKYLISYCSSLIQQIPAEHQQKIANELFQSGKIDIFCDLLVFCDLQFPKGFETMKEKAKSHERLQNIIEQRENVHNAIKEEKYEGIEKFVVSSTLKHVYNIQNNTAMYTALSNTKFQVFFHLMSLGFKGPDCVKLKESFDGNEMLEIAQTNAMKKNLVGSDTHENMAIYHLVARSRIFGKYSQEQCRKIKEWFDAINNIELENSIEPENSIKIGSYFLNAASQCHRLMIIFDFESDNVERVDLENPDSDGIMYPGKKLVIVAAKHSTMEEEQKVKGVLAHELWHYVMRIVFENADQPYLNENDERFKAYRQIVDELRDLVLEEEDGKIFNDGCDGIISSVFHLYREGDFDAELIVRPIQILARYDDDAVKVGQLIKRYKKLFNLIDQHLIIPMKELNMRHRDDVRTFNKSAGFISNFLIDKFNFSVKKGIEEIVDKKIVVARSNVPKLLLALFYSHWKFKNGNLVDGKCIFISSEMLKSAKIELEEILEEDLKVFIDFSSDCLEILKNFDFYSCSNFFFVTYSNIQHEELSKLLMEKVGKVEKLEIDYEWKDLSKDTQDWLLTMKVNFQNNHMPLGNMLECPQKVITTKVLNAILENKKLSINSSEEAKDNFYETFQKRNFLWNGQLIALEELLEKTKNEKFVLISDVAGSGKSWAMKNISRELGRSNPAKWLTFIDLKQLFPTFSNKKHQIYFENFLVDEILVGKSEFEIEVFKMKYKRGNLLIFFDGFDEIAPTFTYFVDELMKTFETHGNNQLWISTRNLFENDLCEKLEAPFTCKLAEFTFENGIELISIIWRLHNLRSGNELDFEKDVPKYVEENYKAEAREICQKMSKTDLDGIGQPLIYKMLADVTKINKTEFENKNFCHYKLFKEFWRVSYEEWSSKKGEIRKVKNIESIESDFTMINLHQLKAMQKFMSGKTSYCDLHVDNEEDWTDEDIIGCGLITKNGENYIFIHETFGEFFIAHFIVQNLNKPKVFEFIEEAVTNPKHEIIRMLLNEALAIEEKVKGKLEKNAQKVGKKAKLAGNLYEIFTKNLQHLVNLETFWFLALKHQNQENLAETLAENVIKLICVHGSEITENSQKIFLEIFKTNLDIPTIKNVTEKMAKKTRSTIIQELLNFRNNLGENIFLVLQKTGTFEKQTLEKLIEIMKQFLSEAEIADKIMMCRNSGESNMHYCVQHQNIQNLQTLWIEFENFLGAKKFKQLLLLRTKSLGETILHHAALFPKLIIFHEMFWDLLLKTFENDKEELKNIAVTQNVEKYNFIFKMLQANNSDVLNWTFNKLEETFSSEEVRDILRMKDYQNIKLLQHAVKYSKSYQTHEVLWNFFSKLFDSKELLEFVIGTGDFGRNLLYYLLQHSTAEIFNFYIQELEKVITKEDIRKVLCCSDYLGLNILHGLAYHHNDFEVYKNLWVILRKYFDSSEILKILSHQDYLGDNFLQVSNLYRSKEVIEFTKLEIIEEITENWTNNVEFLEDFITAIDRKMLDFKDRKDFKILSLSWVSQVENFVFSEPKDIERLALSPDKENHEKYWTFLLNKFEKPKIKEILLVKNIFDANFVHEVLRNENLEVIQLTFENMKLCSINLKDIFDSTASNGRNLLQHSSCKSVDIKVYEYLWEVMRSHFSQDEIFDILGHKDKFENNLLQFVAENSTAGIVEFTWQQIDEILENDKDKLKSLLHERNVNGKNVLHVCCASIVSKKLSIFWTEMEKVFTSKNEFKSFVKQNTSVDQATILHQVSQLCKNIEFIKTLWELLSKTFTNINELLDFVLSKDGFGDNFLFIFIRSSIPCEVFEFIFEIFKETFSPAQFNEILISTRLDGRNIVHYTLQFSKDIMIHKVLWKNLSSCGGFLDVLVGVSWSGLSVLNYAAIVSTAEILDFMYEELKKLNNKEKVKKIFLSGLNLLNCALKINDKLDIHKILWKMVQTFLDETEILHLIHSGDENGDNLLQAAIKVNTKDVVALTWTQVKASLNAITQHNYLRKRKFDGLSLIGIAATYNRPTEVIELIKSYIKETQIEGK